MLCLKIPERHTTILNWNGPFSWPGKVLPFLQNNTDVTRPQHVEGKIAMIYTTIFWKENAPVAREGWHEKVAG